MTKLSVSFASLILIVIGGWFVINSLLPMLGVGDCYSLTVGALAFIIFLGLDVSASTAEILIYMLSVVGALCVIAGFMLMTGGDEGRGRLMSKTMLSVMMGLSGLALIFCFALMGYEGAAIFGFFEEAFSSGNLVDMIMPIIEPLLILVGSILAFFLSFGAKKKKEA